MAQSGKKTTIKTQNVLLFNFLLFGFDVFQEIIYLSHPTIISSYTMKTGTIKFFNATKGFGFITEDGTGVEIFLHATGLADQPVNSGDKVSFDVADGRKGLNAINVMKI